MIKKQSMPFRTGSFISFIFVTFILNYFLVMRPVSVVGDPTSRIQLALTLVAIIFVALVSLFVLAKLIYWVLPDSSLDHFMQFLVYATSAVFGTSIAALIMSLVLRAMLS